MFKFIVRQEIKVDQAFEFGEYVLLNRWEITADSGNQAIEKAKMLIKHCDKGMLTYEQI